jgi:hypothetical protein
MCAAAFVVALAAAQDSPPAFMLGTFRDDYGGTHVVSADWWQQGGYRDTADRYRIVKWAVSARYLIAENAATNASAPGKWTRIDWVPLDESMAPWTWAFCFSAFDAPTREKAAAASANQAAPRTGCNGHPFSRMTRVPQKSIP